nr:unnamed protein product [Callosobruchus chinensis]
MRQCKYCVDKTTGMAEYSETRCTCKQNLCRHCNAKFKGKQSLDDHIVKNHKEFIADVSSKIHECKHCSYKTTNVAYLNNTHMAKHLRVGCNVKRLLCKYCNASFRVKKTLDDHILKNHEECIASVSSKIHQSKHVMTHSECANRNLCAHCNGKFKSKKALDDHIVKNHREFIASVSSKIHKCEHCSYRTTIASHLVGHMTKHPESECSVEQKLCTHCDAAFKSKKALDDHVVKNHREFIASVSTKIYECEHCSYKTTISSHLVSHLAKHPESGCNVKPNSCRHCGATFKRKTALDDHILKKHKEFIADVSCKIHECRYCSYKTTMAAHLTGHNMTRHSKTVTGD